MGYFFLFIIPQNHSEYYSDSIFCRALLGYCAKGCTLILRKFDLNPANDGASAKASPFHVLIVLGKKRLSIQASCMAICLNYILWFFSSDRIRLKKDAFEGHLCQTINTFVKHNKPSPLAVSFEKEAATSSSISETLEYLEYLLLTNLDYKVYLSKK